MRNRWGNQAPAVTATQVAKLHKTTNPTSDQVIIFGHPLGDQWYRTVHRHIDERRRILVKHDGVAGESRHIRCEALGVVTMTARAIARVVIPGGEERGKAADTLRRLYWDTALSWHPANLRMLRSVAGMGQVLFGSDYPYLRRDLAVSCRSEVESSAELQANEARAVLAGNAFELFPRFAGHAAAQTTNTA